MTATIDVWPATEGMLACTGEGKEESNGLTAM